MLSKSLVHVPIYDIAMRPLRCLFILLGVVPYEPRNPRLAHNVRGTPTCVSLWRLTHMLSFCALIYWLSHLHYTHSNQIWYDAADGISTSFDLLTNLALMAAHLIAQCESTLKSRRCGEIFAKFQLVQRQLDRDSQGNQTRATLRLLCGLIYAALALYYVVLLAFTAVLYVRCPCGERMLYVLYSEVIIKLKIFEFAIFVLVASVLLSALCATARDFVADVQLSGTEACSAAQRRCFARLALLQDLHSQLWANTQRIGDYFAWSMPALLLKFFIDLTLLTYWIWISSNVPWDFAITQYAITFMAMQMALLVFVFFLCAAYSRLHRQLRSTLHELAANRRCSHFQAGMRITLLQLHHEPIQISAGGCLIIDRNSLGQMLFTMLTYSVILIQFRMTY